MTAITAIVLLICTSLTPPLQAQTAHDAGKLRTELESRVKSAETGFLNSIMEVHSFEWVEQQYVPVAVKYTVRSGERFLERSRMLQRANAPWSKSCRAYDGSRLITIENNFHVKELTGIRIDPPENLYSPILVALGIESSLSQFLEEEDGLNKVTLEVRKEEGTVVSVCQTSTFPGKKSSRVTRIQFDTGKSPVQILSASAGDSNADAPARSLTVFDWVYAADSVRYSMVSHRITSQSHQERLVRLQVNQQSPLVDNSVFRFMEYNGNPTIETFRDGVLVETRMNRPEKVAERPKWSPAVIWIVVNIVLVDVGLVIYCIRYLFTKRNTGLSHTIDGELNVSQ